VAFDRGGCTCAKHGGVIRDLNPVAARKAVRPVRLSFGVGERLEGDGAGLQELLHVVVRPLPDNGDPDLPLDEFLVTVAQLRDVPAAERSAVVAKEDEGDGLLGPKAFEMCRRAVEGEDLRVGRALACLRVHARERIGPNLAERIGDRADTL
jgi:hypothetical protein